MEEIYKVIVDFPVILNLPFRIFQNRQVDPHW